MAYRERSRQYEHLAPTSRDRPDTETDVSRRRVRPPPRNPPPPRSRNVPRPRPRPPSSNSCDEEQDEDESPDDEAVSVLSRSPPPQVKHRPKYIINWRSELCRLLQVSDHTSDDEILELMDEAEEKLRDAERLQYQFATDPGPLRSQVVYKIRCYEARYNPDMVYLDPPLVVDSGTYHSHLIGSRGITNMELYLERNKNISVLVHREYACCKGPTFVKRPSQGEKSTEADLELFFEREHVELVSEELQTALTDLSELALNDIPHPRFDGGKPGAISYPYLWWFHRRGEIENALKKMSLADQLHIEVVQNYMQERLKSDWSRVDELTARGMITLELLEYIFVPNSILISKARGNSIAQLDGLTAQNWLMVDSYLPERFAARIQGSFWEFSGSFQSRSVTLPLVHVPVISSTEEFRIIDLAVYPARFAEKSVPEALRRRGEMFWKCRYRHYVSYVKDAPDVVQPLFNSRFMVDMETYNKMHSVQPQEQRPPDRRHHEAERSPIDMSSETPPSEDGFLMCLPSTLRGFDMNKKEWRLLEVAFMREVVWNDEAFKDLVINPKTKRLVQAVVTNRLRSEEGTDLIKGKGNGLFILLHGGPGTGKTLTAESVAEIARKPLYKVTCGDIGTKADEVEKYLEVVSLLGKTWGCVVLLDEADVFLEQRSLANLERNALVSGMSLLCVAT
nr:ATPase [Colletotrichum truncatum]KAF6783246.1 ATPase [Colletotrichum truncatum]